MQETSDFSDMIEQARMEACAPASIRQSTVEELPLLNGIPYRTFRKTEPVEARRAEGAFFSGQALANRLSALVDIINH